MIQNFKDATRDRAIRSYPLQIAPPRVAQEVLAQIQMPAQVQPPGHLSLECVSKLSAVVAAEVARQIGSLPTHVPSVSRIPCPTARNLKKRASHDAGRSRNPPRPQSMLASMHKTAGGRTSGLGKEDMWRDKQGAGDESQVRHQPSARCRRLFRMSRASLLSARRRIGAICLCLCILRSIPHLSMHVHM